MCNGVYLENFERLIKILQEKSKNFKISVFRINPKEKVKKIGRDWGKLNLFFKKI